jgi:hypothetical protein
MLPTTTTGTGFSLTLDLAVRFFCRIMAIALNKTEIGHRRSSQGAFLYHAFSKKLIQ